MLRNDEDAQLFKEYRTIIQNVSARQAYDYLIGWGAGSSDYICYPSSHGHIKDVRFVLDENWYFAFIPNQQWLLFYFRKPCLGLAKFSQSSIMQNIPSASETNAGEFTVRIFSIEDALLVAQYVES